MTVLRSQQPAVHSRDVRPVGQPSPQERAHRAAVERQEDTEPRIARTPAGEAWLDRVKRL